MYKVGLVSLMFHNDLICSGDVSCDFFIMIVMGSARDVFPILHVAEMWKRGHNNLIQVALVFIPFS